MGYLTKNVLKIAGFPIKCPQGPLVPLAAFFRSANKFLFAGIVTAIKPERFCQITVSKKIYKHSAIIHLIKGQVKLCHSNHYGHFVNIGRYGLTHYGAKNRQNED